MNELQLVLASRSPRRYELLSLLGLPFEVTAANVRETPQPGETPAELVVRLSRAKAIAARLADRRDVLVLGCDTIVALDGDTLAQGHILGKPRGIREAEAMLRLLRGRTHVVYSAITILDPGNRAATELAQTHLRMRAYKEAEIKAYAASGDPLDKAGAYAIQHAGFHPVEEIRGCYASVMGLPLCHLARGLREWGIEPAADIPTVCQAYTGHRCAIYAEIMTV